MNTIQEKVLRRLRQQAVIIDGKETISVRGVHIPHTIDGRRTLEVLMEGANIEAYSSGLRQAQRKFDLILGDDDRTKELIGAAARLSRTDDSDRIKNK